MKQKSADIENSDRESRKKTHIVIGCILVTAGISILAVAHALTYYSADEFWHVLVRDIGIALIPIGLIVLVYERWLREDFLKSIVDAMHIEIIKIIGHKEPIKYFKTRDEMTPIYSIPKTLEMAKKETEILIIGRSLISWAERVSRQPIERAIQEKSLKFKVLCLDPRAKFTLLSEDEQTELKKDMPKAIAAFRTLSKNHSDNFFFKVTPNVILESMTFFTKEDGESVLLFDIDLFNPNEKAVLEIKNVDPDQKYLYEKLYDRANKLYEGGGRCLEKTNVASKIRRIIKSFDVDRDVEKENFRENLPSNYIFYLPKIFRSIINNYPEVPPPLCVQIEVTNRCNTKCIMCERWMWYKRYPERYNNELTSDEIKEIIGSISEFGVKSVIFSGGEPLLKENFEDILRHTKELNLHAGVLTDGLNIAENENLAKIIVDCVDWIRISLDGSSAKIHENIRRGGDFNKVLEALKILNRCRKESKSPLKIGVCYTINNLNVDDVENMVGFYKERMSVNHEEHIDSIFFKFAHSDEQYACSADQIDKLEETIKKKEFDKIGGTNFDYLRYFIETMGVESIASGKPLKSFYNDKKVRCFTPYLFGLIDAFGDVSPCCHLYYDNKGPDVPERQDAICGNIKRSNFDFRKIWNSKEYQKFRSKVERISPENAQCRDCTRHYFHNEFITDLFEFYHELGLTSQEFFEEYINETYKEQVVSF